MAGYKNKVLGAVVLGMLALTLGGCQKEGPAEKAGKEIDKAMSSAGSEIQAAGNKVESALK